MSTVITRHLREALRILDISDKRINYRHVKKSPVEFIRGLSYCLPNGRPSFTRKSRHSTVKAVALVRILKFGPPGVTGR